MTRPCSASDAAAGPATRSGRQRHRRGRLVIGLLLAAACGSRSASPVRINEVVPANGKGCADARGERDDWVELWNGGAEAIDLGGYAITDDTGKPEKHVFAGGVTIAAGGTLLLWADGTVDQGPTHLPFRLGAQAEEVALHDPEGKLVDELSWTGALSDVSLARLPDGTGGFVRCATPTCGAPNGSSCSP